MIRTNFFFPFTYDSSGNIVFSKIIDVSASTAGIKVESTRTSPSSSDTQNVYSGTYTPTYARTGATFSQVQTSQYFRCGNIVWVCGYADMSAGGGTNACTITLPITPTSFGAGVAPRARCEGVNLSDANTPYVIVGTTSGTTAEIQGMPDGATGLRWHCMYRIA